MTQTDTPTATQAAMLELAFRLGVPTFVLAALLLMIMPRVDRAISIGERVDAELNIVIARCGYAPMDAPLPLVDQRPIESIGPPDPLGRKSS